MRGPDDRAVGAPDQGVAIVGMALRFPGADSPERLWQNIVDGVESIDRHPRPGGEANAAVPSEVHARGRIGDVAAFDAEFFGMSAREAAVTDPQHRIFLECAHEALEQAGYAADGPERIGVFAGVSHSAFGVVAEAERAALGSEQLSIALEPDFFATRVAHRLGLRGPALTIQTGCSTGLVATHVALRALQAHDCDVALVGAASIVYPYDAGYLHDPGGIMSPDGHCRPFDQSANGTVPGDGVGVILLRRLDDALRARDEISAVVRGSAINNDGSLKSGFTAPSVRGQADVIRSALRAAGISSDAIGYVEAHGTGTYVGDPVEIAALGRGFAASADGSRVHPCGVGSVKASIGHLDAAAGIAGLIKAALAVQHGTIPPCVNLRALNPELELDSTPFAFPSEAQRWRTAAPHHHRRAGVSSFGVGGTNGHVIVEQAPAVGAPSEDDPGPQVLTLSADSADRASALATRLADHLEHDERCNLADVAFTLHTGRRRRGLRASVVASTAAEAAARLRQLAEAPPQHRSPSPRSLVWMFPGQGTQSPGMAHDLHAGEPVFRRCLDGCLEILEDRGASLRGLLLGREHAASDAQLLTRTELAQPALVAVGVALAGLWKSWGFSPTALIGHSVGELTAACVAGAVDLQDGLRLAVERGRLMQEAEPGAMVAVSGPSRLAVAAAAEWELDVAAENGPTATVLAGPRDVVETAAQSLGRRGLGATILRTSHAFHSRAMDAAAEAFGETAGAVSFKDPAIPYVSNVDGEWVTRALLSDPSYWRAQVRSTVRFGLGLAAVASREAVAVEMGPRSSLASIIALDPAASETVHAVAAMPSPGPGSGRATRAGFAEVVDLGLEPDWAIAYGARRRRVKLPGSPLRRTRLWPREDPGATTHRLGAAPSSGPALGIQRWVRLPRVPSGGPALGRCQVVGPEGPIREWVFRTLRHETGDEPFAGTAEAFASASESVSEVFFVPGGRDTPAANARDHLATLLRLATLISDRGSSGSAPRLQLVTSGAVDVFGDDRTDPGTAALLGSAAVLRQESPSVRMRIYDVPVDELDRASGAAFGRAVRTPGNELVLALRRGELWGRRLERLSEDHGDPAPVTPWSGKAWLITGAAGNVGGVLATHLARQGADVALMARRPSPTLDRLVATCEGAGARVLALHCDVSDSAALTASVDRARSELGALDGVIHAAGCTANDLFAPAHRTTRRHIDEHFAAKVDGTANLRVALAGSARTRCILFSSLAATLGGLGYAAYAAANAFQDATAIECAHEGLPWTSIGWDGWALGEELGAKAADLLTSEEGLALLERALTVPEPQLFAYKRDVARRLAEWVEGDAAPASDADADADAASPSGEDGTAREALSAELVAQVFSDALGAEAFGVDDDFYAEGGHSLLAVQVAATLSRLTTERLAPSVIIEERTPARIVAAVGAPGRLSPAGPTEVLAAGRGEGLLVLLPPLGGDVDCYRSLVGELRCELTVVALREPDLFSAAEQDNAIAAVASRAVEAIDTGLEHLVGVAGWSYGGVVAFEVARRLASHGARPPRVLMLDSPAPADPPGTFHLEADGVLLEAFAAELAERAGRSWRAPGDDAALADVVSQMQALGLWTVDDTARLRELIDGYRSRIRGLETYRPDPCPVDVTYISAAASGAAAPTDRLAPAQWPSAWRRLCGGTLTVHQVEAAHATMLSPPWASATAAAVQRWVDELSRFGAHTPLAH